MLDTFGTKPCDGCGNSEEYCPECSTCHACLREHEESASAASNKRIEELVEVCKAMREWIDAVPKGTQLPVMPGFDRDWADSVINGDVIEDDD